MGNFICSVEGDRSLEYTIMLMGPSGIGKSTFVRKLTKQQPSSAPTIRIERQQVQVGNCQITLIDTPGVCALFRSSVTQMLLTQVDAIIHFSANCHLHDSVETLNIECSCHKHAIKIFFVNYVNIHESSEEDLRRILKKVLTQKGELKSNTKHQGCFREEELLSHLHNISGHVYQIKN